MRKVFDIINTNLSISRLSRSASKNTKSKSLPLITISREAGSGAHPIAHIAAKKLGKAWKVYNEEIISEIAKEAKLEKKLIEDIDESKIPMIQELIDDFFGRRYLSLHAYYRHLVRILSSIGQRGNAIIIGRGANFLFPQALKIRVICEMEQRISWVMEFKKVSRVKAIKVIEESDQKRKDFARTLFDHDPRKAHHYDLIIRTGKDMSVEDAASLIILAAKRRFKIR